MAEKTIGVDIEEDLHERARLTAVKRKVPVKALYSQGLIIALDGIPGTRYPYADHNRELHEKLERILNSGHIDTIKAVVPNIEIFFDRLHRPGKRRSIGNITEQSTGLEQKTIPGSAQLSIAKNASAVPQSEDGQIVDLPADHAKRSPEGIPGSGSPPAAPGHRPKKQTPPPQNDPRRRKG